MKQVFRLLSILLFAALVVSSCREDEDRFVPYDESEITTSVSGMVTDEGGVAVADAQVRLLDKVIQTDKNGVFSFDKVKVKSQAFIQVNKDGYFFGSRTIFPRKGERQLVRINLLQKLFTHSFSSAAGAVVDIEGVSVEFPANAIVDGANAYTGEVKVALKYLDPSLASTGFEMPGALVGMSSAGERQSMASFSMIAVELQGSAGQKLNLGNGKKAKVTFPIPASLQASAPSSIPLWSFNEVSGYWEEEGSAVKTGNTYVGEVGHFSFWNCDASFPLIHLSGTLVDPDNNAMQAMIRITVTSSGMVAYGWVNSEGFFEGKVPKDEALTLDVLDMCGDVVYTQNIGPYSADVTLSSINIPQSTKLTQVTGTVVDCNNQAIESAYVLIDMGGGNQVVYTDNAGSFETSQFNCSVTNEVTIKALDLSNFLESDVIVLPVTPEVNAGAIQVCSNPLSEYIRFNIDGGADHVTPIVSINDTTAQSLFFSVFGGGTSGEPTKVYEFFLHGEGAKVLGVPSTIKDIAIYISEVGGAQVNYSSDTGIGLLNWTVVASQVGDYYEGNFNVPDLTGGTPGLHVLNGTFRIKRSQ